MNDKYVAIEAQTLMGDSRPTYFVDIVNVKEGVANHGNLRSCDDVHLARQIARDVASVVPCRVVDETMTGA
jgi:hypothetical protein